MAQRPSAPPRRQSAPPQPPSGAAIGLTVFASVVLMIGGFNQTLMGLVAVVNDEFFVVGKEYLFTFDTTVWGWIHILIGLVLLGAGFGLFNGAVWARAVGVAVAALTIVANFLWIPFYPLWSIVLIALGVFVIWALTIHGRDITRAG
jgi:hypothetical protein